VIGNLKKDPQVEGDSRLEKQGQEGATGVSKGKSHRWGGH